MLDKVCKRFALFMNWFNGICAPVCGIWMMLSALFELPLSWNSMMPMRTCQGKTNWRVLSDFCRRHLQYQQKDNMINITI